MRNFMAAVLSIAMLATSALIALDVALLMRAPLHGVAPEAAGDPSSGHDSLIATFYDAANTVLAGEPSPLLGTVVSPEIETHVGAGPAATGEDGMREYLAGLRQRGAGALTVGRLIGSGDEVAVVVGAHEAPPEGADFALESFSPRWRTIDLFRIAAGMIVGYWPGSLGDPASPSLPNLALPATAEAMSVSVARLEIGPHAEPTPLVAPVPHLLIVETGTVAIARSNAFQIARAGASRFVPMPADPGAGELHAGPGDALLLPPVRSHLIRNPGASSASTFSLLVAPNELVFGQVRAGPASQMTVAAMHDGWRIGRRTMWDNGAVTEPLAVKHLPLNRGRADVSLTSSQVALEPGQRQPPLAPGNLRLAIVRSGVVGVSVINSDAVPISVPMPDSQLAAAADHLFRAGDAFWIEASEAPVLANAGVTPLDILLIDVIPHKDDARATPASYATSPLET